MDLNNQPTMMSHSQPPNFVAHLAHSKLLVPKKHQITNDYILVSKTVGTGWQGKVLQCIHKATSATRALKILRDVPKSRRAVDLQWHTCSHPNIVSIIDVYENIFMGHMSLLVVMEYMEGGELFYRIQKKGHFTEREAAETVRSICLAVAHLHFLNIAHRDLCPENLLFLDDSPSAVLKLGGFGFAKEATNGLQTPCYTPYYVAPEVLGPEMYDKSCDMWSLGVITYILLCGFPPFYSESGKPISPGMKKRICQGSYTFPDPEWTHISKEAKDLVKNLLKTNPQERLKVDEVLHHPWIANYDKLPETPLASRRVDPEFCSEVQTEMSHALATMRDREEATEITLKDVATSNNPILARRVKKRANEET